MGERLREVPDLSLERRMILLGEEADVVADGEQPLEQRARLVVPALQQIVVGEPEGAGEECAFARLAVRRR